MRTLLTGFADELVKLSAPARSLVPASQPAKPVPTAGPAKGRIAPPRPQSFDQAAPGAPRTRWKPAPVVRDRPAVAPALKPGRQQAPRSKQSRGSTEILRGFTGTPIKKLRQQSFEWGASPAEQKRRQSLPPAAIRPPGASDREWGAKASFPPRWSPTIVKGREVAARKRQVAAARRQEQATRLRRFTRKPAARWMDESVSRRAAAPTQPASSPTTAPPPPKATM